MTYLLDVNALLALGFVYHVHHRRVEAWVRRARENSDDRVVLASCSITEIGFVRVASGGAALASSVGKAKEELLRLRCTKELVFLHDRVSVEYLPEWVSKPAQVTDGHLLQLARFHGARLATLDTGIPGAEWIADEPSGPMEVRDSSPRLPYGNHGEALQTHSSACLVLH